MENLKRLFKEANVDLKTMIVFHKAERLIRASEAHIFKKHQLTPTQFSVLETLYSKGDLRIQDLIDSILATSGNMTVVIRNMVRDGWITRETDPEAVSYTHLLFRRMKVRNTIPSLSPYLISCPFSSIQSVRVGKKGVLSGLAQEK